MANNAETLLDTSDFVFDFLEDLGKLMGRHVGLDPTRVLPRDQWVKTLSSDRIFRAFETMYDHLEARHGNTANVHLTKSGPYTTMGVAHSFMALLDVRGRDNRRDRVLLLADLHCALREFLVALLTPLTRQAGDRVSLGELLTREEYRLAVEKGLSKVPEAARDQVVEEAKQRLRMLDGVPEPEEVRKLVEMVALVRLPTISTTLVPKPGPRGKLN